MMAVQNIILIFIFLIAIIIVAIKLYCDDKSKELRQEGYEFLYYYISNYQKLSYYRTPQKHISFKFKTSYDKLIVNKDKWFITQGSKQIICNLITFYEKATSLTSGIVPYFSLNHYFAYSEYLSFSEKTKQVEDLMRGISGDEYVNYVKLKYNQSIISQKIEHKFDVLKNIHNQEFIRKELKDNEKYFDNLLKYPLDKQQRESIVKLEDNCLVISSAGSGKTSTTIAKVKYLLDKRHLRKEEILVLSYNRKTADEFQERLDISGIACKTFHALALSIIGKVEKTVPDVCDSNFLITCFYNLIRKDENFKKDVVEYFTKVSCLTKNEHEYKNGKDYHDDRKTYGIMAPYVDMNGSPIFTRSEEEKKICTWLTTHGVDFLYEKHYPIKTADTVHRQYKPDFTINFNLNGKQYCVFLEHFGIDTNGNVPKWFGEGHAGGYYAANRKYNSDIEWKRAIHKLNKTYLIETTSAMFHNRTIFEHLKNQLQQIGIPCNELSVEEKFAKLIDRNKAMEDSIMNLFSSFISLMKSNGKSFNEIMTTITESNQSKDFCNRSRFFIYKLIKPLYEEYQNSLKEKGQMDFTDLILHAANLCNSRSYETPYKYILVDEFQDISVDRYKFILSLRNYYPRTKTYCVGDDWQSIYRFSGSDMNLFNDFEKYFGATERCKIETTYRFGNPLVEKSSEFILKNPLQVQKAVKPYSDITSTELTFVPFSRTTNEVYLNKIKELLNKIPANESVMLIARYNYEVKVFPSYCVEQAPNSKRAKVRFANRVMDFMSVHAAKGLEADNVLILNCSQDGGGFPSRVTDDPILGYVLSEIDNFEYSEERRLFYVAITRAKKHIYVLYNEDMPSIFVTEMIENDEEQLLCPRCKSGCLKLIKEAIAKNGNPYKNYRCSNSVAGCSYFWQVYFDKDDEEMNVKIKYEEQIKPYFETVEKEADDLDMIFRSTFSKGR